MKHVNHWGGRKVKEHCKMKFTAMLVVLMLASLQYASCEATTTGATMTNQTGASTAKSGATCVDVSIFAAVFLATIYAITATLA
ncbi:hypothetical protein DPMN_130689 [Dreissena polymorpha]|uniref:Uncharacterized protein n=1 Tax=Dreissena polymorpha TaxID=45954 RepID=A0A9D4HBG4_DREPO|nr:hypothetical protein DPMN_130689 [Dreissena polymorpha]